MKTAQSIWVFVGFGAAATFLAGAAGRWMFTADVQDGGGAQLAQQVWIDHLPKNHRDFVRQFVAVEQKGQKVGVVARNSRYRIRADFFAWKLDGHCLDLEFLQSGHKVGLDARVSECKGEAPHPFELCLDLKTKTKSVRLYSRKDWKVRPRADGAGWESSAEVQMVLPETGTRVGEGAHESEGDTDIESLFE